jgi:thymidylate synthase (FAD)
MLLSAGWVAQQARAVLPNSLKTEIVMTANVREWRHVFELRTSSAAHPQMTELMRPMLAEFTRTWPTLFGDITWEK